MEIMEIIHRSIVVTNILASNEAKDISQAFQPVLPEDDPLTEECTHDYHYGPGVLSASGFDAIHIWRHAMQATGVDD